MTGLSELWFFLFAPRAMGIRTAPWGGRGEGGCMSAHFLGTVSAAVTRPGTRPVAGQASLGWESAPATRLSLAGPLARREAGSAKQRAGGSLSHTAPRSAVDPTQEEKPRIQVLLPGL